MLMVDDAGGVPLQLMLVVWCGVVVDEEGEWGDNAGWELGIGEGEAKGRGFNGGGVVASCGVSSFYKIGYERAMTSKRKPTLVGNGEKDERIQPLRDGNIRAEIQDGRDHHAVHVQEEIQRIQAMDRKGKAMYVGRGKQNSKTQPLHEINIGAAREGHYANIGNNARIREVESLRDKNVGVEIHEERNVNIIHIHEVRAPLVKDSTEKNDNHQVRAPFEASIVGSISLFHLRQPNTNAVVHVLSSISSVSSVPMMDHQLRPSNQFTSSLVSV
ncbi:hypothetical protein RHMOL_Rhmol01G0252800 [Rhododendron molle]|uniref:Uncharacterized protein n=1 Tax=Rhododendron molle TaxID=49168 RepID=A0ACC0Q6L1_RHOML|nr:hypothetical protein RHMOL_Rhmol01G0252800 [Rhododendron molle]